MRAVFGHMSVKFVNLNIGGILTMQISSSDYQHQIILQ